MSKKLLKGRPRLLVSGVQTELFDRSCDLRSIVTCISFGPSERGQGILLFGYKQGLYLSLMVIY